MITIAADKDEGQRVRLGNVGLEEDGLGVVAVAAPGVLRSGQGWVVGDGRWNRVQDVSDLLFQFVPIDQWLVGGSLGVSAQSAGVSQGSGTLVLLVGGVAKGWKIGVLYQCTPFNDHTHTQSAQVGIQ